MQQNTGSTQYVRLPQPLTPLVGRDEETAAIHQLLGMADVRLVTLVGIGGVGKTRLAINIARMFSESAAEGVVFVALSGVSEPQLVLSALAQTLGLSTGEQLTTLEILQTFLGTRRFLLIVDNFEHLLPAAPQLEALLMACPQLKLLVTSRTVLRIQGEHTFPVIPLAHPDPKEVPAKESILDYPAIALFVQRVQAILPTFQLTDTNVFTIAAICSHLDGLPLALELAAVRMKLFSPQELLKRLAQRLQILDRGSTTLPERQQTLRATLHWSYGLLSSDEQWLFRLLSVFVGGWTLDALEAICLQLKGDRFNTLNTISALMDHSLVQQASNNNGPTRLNILDTVREYGHECLLAEQEQEASCQAHAHYYLTLAETFALQRRQNGSHIQWIEQLAAEQENLRAALHFFIEHKEAHLAVRLSSALQWYWISRGAFNEGRTFLEAALALSSTGGRTPELARALGAAGDLAHRQGSYTTARALQEEAVASYEQLHDTRGLAEARLKLGLVYAYQQDFTQARALIEHGIALCQQVADPWLMGFAWDTLARLEWREGNNQQAKALCHKILQDLGPMGETRGIISSYKILAALAFTEGDDEQVRDYAHKLLALSEPINDQESRFTAFFLLGDVARNHDEQDTASDFYQKCLAIAQATNGRRNQSMVFARLGELSYWQNSYEEARQHYQTSSQFARPFEEPAIVGWILLGLARLDRIKKHYWQAATRLGAGEASLTLLRDLSPRERQVHERDAMVLRTYLGEEGYTRAFQAGRSMTPEQALAHPLSKLESEPNGQISPPPKYPDGLTEREVEILLLVSAGLTDGQVAEKLVISPRTVQGHLRSIYSKINVNSRNAATRYALDHKLL